MVGARTCSRIIAVAVAGLVLAGTRELSAQQSQVRPSSPEAVELLEDAVWRSPTVARLVAEIETSDVIVYVDRRMNLSSSVAGLTAFMGASHLARFLRVGYSHRLSHTQQIAVLGHELQHVVEVARAPHVRSAESLGMLYSRMNETSVYDAANGRYCSKNAEAVQRLVQHEVRVPEAVAAWRWSQARGLYR
jgi:hypothetical protein